MTPQCTPSTIASTGLPASKTRDGEAAAGGQLLRVLVERFGGGPVGLETLAAAVSEEADTIMDVFEPYLLKIGYLQRTQRGRVASRLAHDRLGLEPPPALLAAVVQQPALFAEDGASA